MRKNRMMRAASALLVAVLMTTGAVSGTFAKYTSQATASDSVTVAKWAFKVGTTDIATTKNFSFNLFTTINDTGNTADETDVVNAKIAPGTAGSFQFSLQNISEVTAKYTITLAQTQTSSAVVPIEYSTDKTNWYSASNFSTTANVAINATATPTIYWRWAIESENTTDTTIGLGTGSAGFKMTVTATVTAEQVD